MKKVAIVVGVVIVAGIIGILVLGKFGALPFVANDTDTSLELGVAGGACTIMTPVAAKDVSVQKNKKITWTVRNTCPAPQAVLLGNFRVNQPSAVQDCNSATLGGAAWPFKDQDQNNRSVTVAPAGSGDIVLREAKNAGSTRITYYFDICVGGTKKDPQLVIDP